MCKMRLTLTFIVLCMVTAYAAAAHVSTEDQKNQTPKAPLHEGNGKIIPDEYIIVFKEEISDDAVNGHMDTLEAMIEHSEDKDDRFMHEYDLGSFRGYAAHMDENTLENIRNMKEISFVEKNQEVYALTNNDPCEEQVSTPPWGLGRTTSRNPLPENQYSYHKMGQGHDVYVYVVDTGIELTHKEFHYGWRAIWGADFIDNPSPKTDLNGHGTHVAGTAIGTNFGIAKWALAVAVRVLGANGGGTSAGVIAGVNWVATDHERRNDTKKSVCNMSLGGGKSAAGNRAVTQAIGKGIHFSVAAGNSNQDACRYSPASTPAAVTVAASDIRDRFAGFSNWGRCVDIIAPGVAVTSAWLNDGMRTISGTSMAAPHVAGVMAKILSLTNATVTPAEMAHYLTETSTKNVITNVRGATPNHLVFKPCPVVS